MCNDYCKQLALSLFLLLSAAAAIRGEGNISANHLRTQHKCRQVEGTQREKEGKTTVAKMTAVIDDVI